MPALGFHCHGLVDFEEAILSNRLQHGEFYNLPEEDLLPIKEKVAKHGLEVSVHCPLVRLSWYPKPPTWAFLCDVDEAKRELNFRMITDTLEKARGLPADHIVAHFPSPSTTDASGFSATEMEEIAWRSASRLAELSEKYKVSIHVEGFGPTPLLSVPFLQKVFAGFPPLRYCFDTGHMMLAMQRDGIDMYDFAQGLAPHVGSMHLWNTRHADDYQAFRHIPVHPSQRPEQGWVDIERVLRLVVPENPAVTVIFESGLRYPEALGGHDYRDGVKWVRDLLAGLS
jgi:sugar phosphate isomerase/epimerase